MFDLGGRARTGAPSSPRVALDGVRWQGRPRAVRDRDPGRRATAQRRQPKAMPIEIILGPKRRVVGRGQGEIDPVHAVLGREQGDLYQRGEFVAGPRPGIGEPGGEFVPPAAPVHHRVGTDRRLP